STLTGIVDVAWKIPPFTQTTLFCWICNNAFSKISKCPPETRTNELVVMVYLDWPLAMIPPTPTPEVIVALELVIVNSAWLSTVRVDEGAIVAVDDWRVS